MTNPSKKPQRTSRRVRWVPEGGKEEYSETPADTRAEDYADRIPNKDEQLKADKPPHWG